MLVLSRQRDEKILIGDDIEVTVVDIRGDKVRLGISAPKSVAVHRKEVYEQIKKENREAAQVQPDDLPGMKLPPKSPESKDAGKPDAKAEAKNETTKVDSKSNSASPEAPVVGGSIPAVNGVKAGAKPESGENPLRS